MQAVGFSAAAVGLSTMIGTPLGGLLFDRKQDYRFVFQSSAVPLQAACLLYLLVSYRPHRRA